MDEFRLYAMKKRPLERNRINEIMLDLMCKYIDLSTKYPNICSLKNILGNMQYNIKRIRSDYSNNTIRVTNYRIKGKHSI